MGKRAGHQGMLNWKKKVTSSKEIFFKTPTGGSGVVIRILVFSACELVGKRGVARFRGAVLYQLSRAKYLGDHKPLRCLSIYFQLMLVLFLALFFSGWL